MLLCHNVVTSGAAVIQTSREVTKRGMCGGLGWGSYKTTSFHLVVSFSPPRNFAEGQYNSTAVMSAGVGGENTNGVTPAIAEATRQGSNLARLKPCLLQTLCDVSVFVVQVLLVLTCHLFVTYSSWSRLLMQHWSNRWGAVCV